MSEAKPVLRLESIVKTFPGVRALDGVDFDVRPGEVHALMGENGAGKSTLFKMLTGQEKPDAGSIDFLSVYMAAVDKEGRPFTDRELLELTELRFDAGLTSSVDVLQQSSQLAELIQNELNTLGGTLNRGVKQAPYKVLTGVACPAVLVEIAFLSNPTEERRLLTEEFQNAAAQAIFSGLAKYIRMQDQD